MWALIIVVMVLSACSSTDAPSSSFTQTTGSGAGVARLSITGSKSFNPAISHGQIQDYQITVSGEGFEPLRLVVDGTATGATLEGIPVGEHRMVHVAAINANGAKVREGEATDVSIGEGVADIPVAMEAVPIFANLSDGARIPNSRLRLQIFSDPAATVEVSSGVGKDTTILTDMVAGRSVVAMDVTSGMGSMVPAKLSPGDYVFTVRDTRTGRSSSVTATVSDGSRERGAPLVSAAMAFGRSGSITVGRFAGILK